MIKVIVVEDELDGMEHILRLLKNNLPEVEVIGTGRSNGELLQLLEIQGLEPDVLLLDIKLPDGQVFQSLELIDTSNVQIIFTTAYNEYALRAFDVAALHYLLKPFSKEDLLSAFQRVKRLVKEKKDTPEQLAIAHGLLEMGPNSVDKVGIGSIDGIRFVCYREIVRMEGDDNYTTFIMADGERIIASRNLGHYTAHYEKYNFIKTHQSHMINLNHMKKYIRGDGGSIELDNGDIVPLARRLRPNFLDRIKAVSELVS